jgi:hypothetical protein
MDGCEEDVEGYDEELEGSEEEEEMVPNDIQERIPSFDV